MRGFYPSVPSLTLPTAFEIQYPEICPWFAVWLWRALSDGKSIATLDPNELDDFFAKKMYKMAS